MGNGLDLIFSPAIMTLSVMGIPLSTYVPYLKHKPINSRIERNPLTMEHFSMFLLTLA